MVRGLPTPTPGARRRLERLAGGILGLTLLFGVTDHAEASSLSLRSRTVYQGWQLRLNNLSLDADRNLNRFYQTIDVGGWDIAEGKVDAVVSLRYVTDFGTGYHRDTALGAPIPAVDGRDDFDLMYAYVDWRILPRRLALRAGRQLILDDLDWYSLDGVKLTTHLMDGAYVEVYGGRAVPYDVFMSSEPFINDGLEVSDGEKLAFGGAAAWRVNQDFNFSVAYRQEIVLRQDDIEVFGGWAPGTPEYDFLQTVSGGRIGLQEQLLGASLSYTIRPIDLEAYGRLSWNLLFGELDQTRAGLNWDPIRAFHAGVEYLRVRPRFAADSIFNLFNIFPYDRARAEVDVELIHGLRLQAGYFLQIMAGGESPSGATYQDSDLVHGPRGGLTYRRGFLGLGAFAEASTNTGGEFAYGGNYRRLELVADATALEGSLNAWLRGNFTGFQDPWFEGRDAGLVPSEEQSLTLDLGARYAFAEYFTASASFIKNFGSLIEGSYRVLTSLEVRYH